MGAGELPLARGQTTREMAAENALGRGEYEQMVVPTYYRTLSEFIEPLGKSAAAGSFELEGTFAWKASAAAVSLTTAIARTGVISFYILCLLALLGLATRRGRSAPAWV